MMGDKRVGFTCGAFDFLHAGHLTLLREAVNHCDFLIVGLHLTPHIDRPSSKNKPLTPAYERYIQLMSTKYVDEVIPYETEEDLYNLLAMLMNRIDVRILGDDYKGKSFTGEGLIREVAYIPRYHNLSSTTVRSRLETRNGKE